MTPNMKLTMSRLLSFFLPLGISASLVTISHVIINSTLARTPQPELVIASYAVAMSVFGVTERSAILLRNTTSALVRDRMSFRSLAMVAFYLVLGIVTIGLIISYTPVGKWIFLHILQVDPALLRPTVQNYQVLMFVTIFSCIRCVYQGVIITNMRTKWLTIGMVFRLAVMYGLSSFLIYTDRMSDPRIGAVIFLSGMIVEATVSYIEGQSLVRKMPKTIDGQQPQTKRSIFNFYRPLMYSSFIAVSVGPSINSFLGKTTDIKLAIASFALAYNLTQLVISFFSYIHQIVLNFYRTDKEIVKRFTLLVSFIPCLLMAIIVYTPLGPWFMETVMGVTNDLMTATIKTMRVFMLMSLIFPWLDFCNGLILLRGQTKITVMSQTANLSLTLLVLIIFVFFTPGWNGMIGALAQSLGLLAELAVLLYVLLIVRRKERHKLDMSHL